MRTEITKCDTPDLSTIIAAIQPVDEKAKVALAAIKEMHWCDADPDQDNCSAEESVLEAVKLLKRMGLAFSTPTAKRITIGSEIIKCATVCHHWTSEDAIRAVAEAIKDEGLPYGASSKPLMEKPELYYERKTEKYFFQAADGVWQGINHSAAVRLLVSAGLSIRQDASNVLSEAEQELVEILNYNPVDYCGPLAGWKTGKHTIADREVLVTRSFKLIEPRKGDFPLITSILVKMLGKTQLQYLLSELKLFYESLRDGVRRPGHLLVLCGPTDAFKSFTQLHIITPLYGGRSADCSRALTNRTDFNSELAGAEHLFLDDQKPYGSWLSRHDFAENLKPYVVGKIMSVHAKGKDAVNLPVHHRVTMSLNDDEIALRSMPDIAASFADKVSIFRCRRARPPMPNSTNAERAAFEAAVSAELPAFIEFLLNWNIPPEIADIRFGVKAYHRPWLIQQIEALSDEARLDELIQATGLVDPEEPWEGTAAELKAQLTRHCSHGREAEKLLGWANATGTLLGRLAKRFPERYQNLRRWKDGKQERRWRLSVAFEARRVSQEIIVKD